MDAVEKHQYIANASFDGGNLDCGNGLLLLIRKQIDVLDKGQILEICSTESSVEEDLPAWCRLTHNDLISCVKIGDKRSFLVSKGPFMPQTTPPASAPAMYGQLNTDLPRISHAAAPIVSVPVLNIEPLSVMGIGSWPRPRWLMRTLHEYLEGKISQDEFQETADDAVRLCVQAQERAGVDVVTDGEQRRDNYASFVGSRLEGCQLVPLQDLLAKVDDPDKFAAQLQALDVSAEKVRTPVVFGKLRHSQALVLHEFEFVRGLCKLPVKVALPGPYLLTRMMWMDCLANKPYSSRQELAADIVKILAEEIHLLMAAGVSMVQLDEPILTEVVFSQENAKQTFMCGALSQRLPTHEELAFAADLINQVVEGVPKERVSIHVCRGNWTPDESAALKGDYLPLVPLFHKVKVGTLLLEFCTPRAGDLQILKYLPPSLRVGIGLVNPKNPNVESFDQVLGKAETALNLIGGDRLLLTPDCGFATFADNPVATAEAARLKLNVLAQVAQKLKA